MKAAFCVAYGRLGEFEKGELKYVELAAADIANAPKEEFVKLFSLIEKNGIEVISANKFVWSDGAICSKDYSAEALKQYVVSVGDRLSALGCPRVVFGSGKARRIDREYGEKNCRRQFDEFLDFSCDVLARYGMKLVIEPLNSKETNFINTVKEGYDVCVRSKRDNCFVLCDYFHLTEENEPMTDLVYSKDRLDHIHIAHPGDRNVPLPDDGYDYSPFFSALRYAGYGSFVSVEARKCDRETLLRSLSYVEKMCK